MRVCFTFILLIASIQILGQGWEPMDFGFRPSAVSSSGVHDIGIDPENGIIYACGGIHIDGRDSVVTGFTKWNRQTNHWQKVIPSLEFNIVRHVMFYAGETYVGRSHAMYRVINEELDTVFGGPEGINSAIYDSKVIDEELYIIGNYDFVGGEPSYGISIFDGEGFTSLFVENDTDFGPVLNDIEVFQDDIYIVGKDLDGWPYHDWRGLAKMSGDSLAVVHDEFTGTFFLMWVYALATYQDQLYIGGLFHQGLGFTGNGIQSFDGVDMHEVGGGVNSIVYDMKVYEGELYVVGTFKYLSNEGSTNWMMSNVGEYCNGVAKWNGDTWTCLNTDLISQGEFRTLEIYDDTLYVGGNFRDLAGDTAMTLIARKRIYPDTTLTIIQEASVIEFSIYPNPTYGDLNIEFIEPITEEGVFRIYNSLGQLLLKRGLERGYRSFNLSPDYPPGLYTVQIQLGESIINKKVVFIE